MSQVKPSSFAIAVAAMADQFKPFCASVALGIVANRHFFDPKYMNRDLMSNEITMILSEWLATEGSGFVLRYLSALLPDSRTALLSEVVREQLQQPVARVLCPFHDRFRGQDDGLFDVTATDTYKSLHWDLVEMLIEFIGIYGASLSESW